MTGQLTGGGLQITEPGLYAGIADDVYHADPVPAGSLSVSGAKVLAEVPARYHYDLTHPAAPRREFDHGHAAHQLVLGVGQQIVELAADNWRSPKVRAVADEQRAAGRIPLLAPDAAMVRAMRDQLRQHPRAVELLSGDGQAEISAFREIDPGVWLRARFDWLAPGRVVDYKTAVSADPAVFVRRAVEYGYHMQAAWYLDMAEALGCDVRDGFRFVVQEKRPPYLVSVVRLDDDTVDLGRAWNAFAIALWRDCRASGEWPGYPAGDVTVTAPPWTPRPPVTDVEPAPIPDDFLAELEALANPTREDTR
ncbi:MAG: PD-(D/E)XK nuclease-like domain-containing protein [Micropruina sp.]|uniref:PD-(D/E)XK nuclease-like domain-containing protein n=1 Tax=Micropruina sp. TaxID=2737536 RepID=UPI0039E2A96F